MLPLPTIQPDIQVSFRYPVHFTRDLFAVSNPLVRNIVAQDGAGPPLNSWWCWTGACIGATPGSSPGSRLTAGITMRWSPWPGRPGCLRGASS